MDTKKCTRCPHEGPRADFPRRKGTSDGRHYLCSRCKSARDNAWRAKHKDRLNRKAAARSAAARQARPVPKGVPGETKECRRCLQLKPLDQFPKDKACKDGRVGRCRLCVKAGRFLYRKKTKARGYVRNRITRGYIPPKVTPLSADQRAEAGKPEAIGAALWAARKAKRRAGASLADEIDSTALAACCEAAQHNDPGRTTRFATFVGVVAKRRIRDMFDAHRKFKPEVSGVRWMPEPRACRDDTRAVDDRDELDVLLGRIRLGQAAILRAHFLDDEPVSSIAARTGLTESQVYYRVAVAVSAARAAHRPSVN